LHRAKKRAATTKARWGFSLHTIAWWPSLAPTLAVLAVATYTDLRSRRIPNWLVFPFLAVGLVVSGWIGGWAGLGRSLEGLALAGFLFGIFFVLGGMGAGDVKLCAAIGAWVGPKQILFALVLTGIVGGIMAVGWAIAGGFLGELFTGTSKLLFGWRKRDKEGEPKMTLANPKARKMPYAPAIAIGTLLSFFTHAH
jgi:prepilin peptidase CpaA